MPSHTLDLFDSAPVPAGKAAGLSLVPAMPEGASPKLARELWLCLLLPGLPLDALAGGGMAPERAACVVDGKGSKQVVVAVNDAAARRGVAPGLGLNAALAIWPELELLERQPPAETLLLQGLARWGNRFTPLVSLEPPQALLAEVRGSLGLFGGAETLRCRAARELRDFGLRAVATLAPTPRAALWLARTGIEVTLESLDGLPLVASRLPLTCLGWPPAVTQTLVTLGTRTVADLVRLPRDGFARRFGPELLGELDEGFGRRPQPRRRAPAPERFDDSLELPAESGSATLIGIALERLLERLQAFLRIRSAGILGVVIEFRHRSAPVTRLRLGLARPSGDGRHLLALLRERLARTPLPAPVVSLRMRSTVVTPLALSPRALPGEAERDADPEAAARLLERLRARLGADAVFSVCLVPEHRPELAWRIAEPLLPSAGASLRKERDPSRPAAGTSRRKERGGRAPPERATSIGASGVGGPAAARALRREEPASGLAIPRSSRKVRASGSGSSSADSAPAAPRPLWMLTEPQRLPERNGAPWHDGRPLELASGPERIETGWWDGRDVRRDYYMAVGGGVRLWVYRERDRGGGWWLHGVFG